MVEDLPDRPRAAVAVVLAPGPDSVLVIRRAERVGDQWSGQLAFPGGRWAPGDTDLAATARRETAEELGFDLSGNEVVAVLDDLAPRTPVLPPILVRPFVFIVAKQHEVRPNHEVDGAWWVPFDAFLTPGSLGPVEFPRYGTLVRSIGYQLEIGVLWGMSERILTPLLQLL
jgi:8-oxo-dGTP pyrophosphatase MutT (NUDIX family)